MKITSPRSGTYTIRPYESGDLAAVIATWQQAFHKPMQQHLWRWKFHDAPYGHQLMLCVHDSGEVAAVFGGVRFPSIWEQQRIWIGHMMDNLSHPSHRGALGGRTGLFVKTVDEFIRVYCGPQASRLLYGLPGERHFRLGARMLAYRSLPGGMRYWVLSMSEPSIARQKPYHGRLRQVQSLDGERLESLSKSCAQTGCLMATRDGPLAHWRFMNHPQCTYQLWSYSGYLGRDWKGYLVTRIDGESAKIVDLLLHPSLTSAEQFLKRTASELGRIGVSSIEAWLPATAARYNDALAKAGFSERQEPLGIIPTARSFDPGLSWEGLAERFFYTHADGDLF